MTPDSMVCAACSLIDARKKKRTRLFIAIDGGAGAGKSMLARGIQAQRESVSILRTDDFFRPLNEYTIAKLAPEKLYELYFQWERMRDEALIPLRRGKTAIYQRYDWSTDRLLEWETIKPTEIVLVEGVYSSRPELRPILDATIFIEAPRVERIRRIKSRNPNEPTNWLTPWLSAEDYYQTQIRPQDTADLILSSVQ
jgi:uridine kinase